MSRQDARETNAIFAAMLLGGAVVVAILIVAFAVLGTNSQKDATATANAPTPTPPEAVVPSIAADFAAAEVNLLPVFDAQNTANEQSGEALLAAYTALDRAADAIILGPDTVRAALRAELLNHPKLHEQMPFYIAIRILDYRESADLRAARRALAGVALEDMRDEAVLINLYIGDLVSVAYWNDYDSDRLFAEAAAWANPEPLKDGQLSTRDYLLDFTSTYIGD